jgi:Zn-dependent membrane protease YugP
MRDYKSEYKNYHSQLEQKKRRAGRNQARRIMERAGRVRKGDGKDVDHRNRNPKLNTLRNLRIQSPAQNRSRNQ